MSRLRHYVDQSPEFQGISERYAQFVKNLDQRDSEAVKVFQPLSENALEELKLIRDVSKYLQKKKQEDVNKAAQAAELAAEEAKKAEVEEKEEQPAAEENQEKKEE